MPKAAPTSFGRILLLVGRVALAAVFLLAAYAKLKPQVGMPWSPASVKISLAMFTKHVYSYQLLSGNCVNCVPHVFPQLELFLGHWLFSGIELRLHSMVTTLLLGG